MNCPVATSLVYDAAGQPLVDGIVELAGHCYLCGSEISKGVPIKQALKDTFNNRDIAIRPDGAGFCCACAFSFDEGCEPLTRLVGCYWKNERDAIAANVSRIETWRKKHKKGKDVVPQQAKEIGIQELWDGWAIPQKFRTYTHLVVDNTWLPLNKSQKDRMREFLLTPHDSYWLACISETGQKHLLFRCPVNYGVGRFRVLFEELIVETEREELERVITLITSLLSLGASKGMVETGNYSQAFLMKTEFDNWERAEGETASFRGRGVFALALFLSQKPEAINGTERTQTNGNRPCGDNSSLDGLGDMEVEGSEVLANSGRQHQVSKLHKRPERVHQYSLFEDATASTSESGRAATNRDNRERTG